MKRVRPVALQIAEIPFVIELPDGTVAQALVEAWRDFLTDAHAAAWKIRFRRDERPLPTGPRTMPLVEGQSIRGAGFEATLFEHGAELVGADERFGVESVLKLLVAKALLPRGGVLVHSVALATEERAAVLLGESGAGKSTLGTLGAEHGLHRLADELVALAQGRAFGTPWNTGLCRSAPLALLGTLGWASEPSLLAVASADFLPLLLSNTLLPDPSAATRASVFQIASGLLRKNPPQRFFFSSDSSAPGFLERALISRAGPSRPPTAG